MRKIWYACTENVLLIRSMIDIEKHFYNRNSFLFSLHRTFWWYKQKSHWFSSHHIICGITGVVLGNVFHKVLSFRRQCLSTSTA
jgi:hypothetical protein